MVKVCVIIVTCFCILLSANLIAQTTDWKMTHKIVVEQYHLFAGGGLASENGTKQLTTGAFARFGFLAGAGATFTLARRWALNADLFYEDKGFNQLVKSSASAGFFDVPPDYSKPSLPVNIYSYNHKAYTTLRIIPQYKIGKSGAIRVGLGPFASKLILANNESVVFQNGVKKADEYLDQKLVHMQYDFGVSFDATYEYKIGQIQTFTGILANVGLYNVGPRFAYLPDYTRGFYIQFGIKLPR